MPVPILCAVHASKIDRVSGIGDMIIAGLMSDNGPSYIVGALAEYIEARKMSHVRGARVVRKRRPRSSAGTKP